MAALCHFYGLSPADLRSARLDEYNALIEFHNEYMRKAARRGKG